MLTGSKILARLRDRSGFTLVEALVAMVTGVIVTGALFAILEVSLRQSSHLSGVAQATVAGRTAMNRIVEELHSACLKAESAPVRESSTASKLVFLNGYDQKEQSKEEPPAELPAAGIHKDEIEYSAAAHTLTDKRYTATSNIQTNGEYPWSTTTTKRVLENVYPVEEPQVEPIFKYYKYAETSSASGAASTLDENTLAKGTEPLGAEAGKTAAVVVSFRVGPQSRAEYKRSAAVEKGQFAEFTTLNTFAFMAPNSEAKVEAAPCE